jgi:hypothetical protein
MPILFNKKASWTLDAKENLIAIVAMFLKFTVDIFPLFNFVLGLAFWQGGHKDKVQKHHTNV